MTTTPSPEAVTLAKTIVSDIFHSNRTIEEIAAMIEGFAITSAEPPMTEAELELEVDDIFIECETKAEMKLAIIALAKKYRG